jgi:hypothetical protein
MLLMKRSITVAGDEGSEVLGAGRWGAAAENVWLVAASAAAGPVPNVSGEVVPRGRPASVAPSEGTPPDADEPAGRSRWLVLPGAGTRFAVVLGVAVGFAVGVAVGVDAGVELTGAMTGVLLAVAIGAATIVGMGVGVVVVVVARPPPLP